jgi:hypothetical protein
LACLPSALAQEAGRTVAVFDFAAVGGDASLAAYGKPVADAIGSELSIVGFKVVPMSKVRAAVAKRKSKAPIALDLDSALAIAKSLGAEVCVVGVISSEGERILLATRAYESDTGRLAVASTQTGSGGVDVYDTIDAAAMKTAVRIRENLRPAAPTEVVVEVERIEVETTVIETGVEKGTPVTVVLRTYYEGAAIFLGDAAPEAGSSAERSLLLNPGGEPSVTLTAKLGVPLVVTMRVPGKHDRTYTFVPEADGNYYELIDAYEVHEWDLGVSYVAHFLEGAQFLGRWMFIPEWCWVGGSLGFGFIPDSFPMATIFSQYPSLKASIDVGSYLFQPPDSAWRMGVSVSAIGQAFITQAGFFFDLLPAIKLRLEWNFPESFIFLQFTFAGKFVYLYTNNAYDTFASYAEAGYVWKF